MKSMAWTLVVACALVWGGAAAGALEAEEAAEAGDAAEGQAGEVAEEAGEAVEAEGAAAEEVLPDKVRQEDEPKPKEEEGARAAARAGAADAAGWLAEAGVALDDEAAYAGALEGVLRAGDPGARILSKGEWEAEVEAEKSASDEVAVEDLPGGFGYVKAGSLSWEAAEKVFEALKAWRDNGAAGVVLDLRGAGGAAGKTYFDTATDERGVEPGTGDRVARFFKDSAGMLRREGEMTWVTECLYEGKNGAPPTMVLVDGETHGEAELLAAELKGSCRGTLLIGQETAGDPLVREPRELPDGRVALLPARKWEMADGTVYDGRRGVVPDIELGDDDKTADAYEPKNPLTLRRNKRGELEEEKVDRALRERIGTDGFLRRAVDILLGLQAMGK